MELQLSKDEQGFRDEVRAFLDQNLSEKIRKGSRATPSVFVEPDIVLVWQKILMDKGWLVYHWPEENCEKNGHQSKIYLST